MSYPPVFGSTNPDATLTLKGNFFFKGFTCQKCGADGGSVVSGTYKARRKAEKFFSNPDVSAAEKAEVHEVLRAFYESHISKSAAKRRFSRLRKLARNFGNYVVRKPGEVIAIVLSAAAFAATVYYGEAGLKSSDAGSAEAHADAQKAHSDAQAIIEALKHNSDHSQPSEAGGAGSLPAPSRHVHKPSRCEDVLPLSLPAEPPEGAQKPAIHPAGRYLKEK